MEPVKVPQHLELEDVLLLGLGAVDLCCLSAGGLLAWWLYLAVSGPLQLRIAAAAPVLVAGLALGGVRIGELSLRAWIRVLVAYLMRIRRQRRRRS